MSAAARRKVSACNPGVIGEAASWRVAGASGGARRGFAPSAREAPRERAVPHCRHVALSHRFMVWHWAQQYSGRATAGVLVGVLVGFAMQRREERREER